MTASEEEVQRRIDRLFHRLERFGDAELVVLRAVWDAGDPRARERAWIHVTDIVRSRDLDGAFDDARARLAAWVNNSPLTGMTGGAILPGNPSGMNFASVRQVALPPMLDAIAATLTADGLDADEATVLLEPLTNMRRPSRT